MDVTSLIILYWNHYGALSVHTLALLLASILWFIQLTLPFGTAKLFEFRSAMKLVDFEKMIAK